MPKDVYIEILFTFTNDFHCVLKLSVYKSCVTRNVCCEHKEVYSLYSFWHHNNKKNLAYKTRQSNSLLCGRCRKRVQKKRREDGGLILQAVQSSTPNLSPPYVLSLFYSISTYSSSLFSSFAHFRLWNHFLGFFSTGAATFNLPSAELFLIPTAATRRLPNLTLPPAHTRNPKNIFENTRFWPVSLLQPILKTEFTA